MPDTPKILTVEEIENLSDPRGMWTGRVPGDHESCEITVGRLRSLCRMARALAWLHENHGGGICIGTLYALGATTPTWEVTDVEGVSHGKRTHPVEAIEEAASHD